MLFLDDLEKRLKNLLLKSLKLKKPDSYNSLYETWLEYNQNLIGFKGDWIKDMPKITPNHIQFQMETLLAWIMKLSLLPINKLENSKIDQLEKFGKKKISIMIFDEDFYAWIKNIQERNFYEDLLEISLLLKQHNFSTFNELYEKFFCKTSRKSRGQFYTELDLADFIIKTSNLNINENNSILDPACGAGAFIVSLLDFFYEKNIEEHNIFGVDISFIACIMSRISYYKWHKEKKIANKMDFIPIFWMNFLIDFDEDLFLKNNKEKIVGINSHQEKLAFVYLDNIMKKGIDYIIGNPPFLRIKNITPELREIYRQKFMAAVGSFDIYTLFIEHALNLVKEKGKIAFICSNKFFTANYGVGIRSVIIDNSIIEKIFNFTDTNLFSVTATTSIIILEKNKDNKDLVYTILTKSKEQNSKIVHLEDFWDILLSKPNKFKTILKIDDLYSNDNNSKKSLLGNNIAILSFMAKQPANDQNWYFLPQNLRTICNKIEKCSNAKLEDISYINVGIKTTCDNVFVKENISFKTKSSLKLIKPLIVGKNVKKWFISLKNKKYLIYPYVYNNGKNEVIKLEDYPELFEYFKVHKDELLARDYIRNSNFKKWYEIWVQLDPKYFERDYKIVTADISHGNRFAIDTSKSFCKGSCYTIRLKKEDVDFYFYLLGLLNSQLLEFYHKTRLATILFSKRWRYMYKQLRLYPIFDIRTSSDKINFYKKIVELVKSIIGNINESDIKEFEEEINGLFYKIYGINEEEKSEIKNYLSINSK